jgi:N6-adenosine-specific RNA methylase IME4
VQHGGADKPFTSSAGSFYDVISIEDLCTLPVKDIRDPEGSVCFMWTTGPILEDSLRLMKAWGFKYKQIGFVWDKKADDVIVHRSAADSRLFLKMLRDKGAGYKLIPDPAGTDDILLVKEGKGQVNPGAYTMTQCEYVLVGTHRRIPKPRGARNVRQFLQSARTKHSAKPHVIRDRIHKMFPNQKKIELFARDSMPGWLAWGNEV